MPVAPTSKILLSMCSVLAWAGGRAGILTDSRQLCQPIRVMCQPMTGCSWEHATSWTTESAVFKKVCRAFSAYAYAIFSVIEKTDGSFAALVFCHIMFDVLYCASVGLGL